MEANHIGIDAGQIYKKQMDEKDKQIKDLTIK